MERQNKLQEDRESLGTTLSVRLPNPLVQHIEKLAKEFGISLAQELRLLVRIGAMVQDRFPRSVEEILGILDKIDFESIERGLNAPIRQLRERIGLVLSELNLGASHPTFILAAVPIHPKNVEIPTLFTSQDAEVIRLLEQPPEIRRNGFDVSTGSSAKIIEGRRRRAMLDKYKSLNLWKDGTLIFAAEGGRDFLCWGNYSKGALRINPLALTEATLLFCKLSKLINNQAQPIPSSVEYTLAMWNMTSGDEPFLLSPGPVQALDFGFDLQTSPREPRATFQYRWSGNEINPGVVAFELVSKVYEWFGLTHDKVPYANKNNEENKLGISSELIMRAGQ